MLLVHYLSKRPKEGLLPLPYCWNRYLTMWPDNQSHMKFNVKSKHQNKIDKSLVSAKVNRHESQYSLTAFIKWNSCVWINKERKPARCNIEKKIKKSKFDKVAEMGKGSHAEILCLLNMHKVEKTYPGTELIFLFNGPKCELLKYNELNRLIFLFSYHKHINLAITFR